MKFIRCIEELFGSEHRRNFYIINYFLNLTDLNAQPNISNVLTSEMKGNSTTVLTTGSRQRLPTF